MKKLLYLAVLAFVFAGCKDKDDDTGTPAPTLSGFKVSFEINGEKFTYTDGEKKYVDNPTSTISSGSPAGVFSTFTTDKDVSGQPKSMSITKVGLTYSGTTCDNGTFNGFFAPGAYVYAGSLSTAGAGIVYYDATGKLYATALGSQGGSSFNITKSTDRTVKGKYYMDVTGDFVCMLYPNSGTPLQVINGKFTATFLNE